MTKDEAKDVIIAAWIFTAEHMFNHDSLEKGIGSETWRKARAWSREKFPDDSPVGKPVHLAQAVQALFNDETPPVQ